MEEWKVVLSGFCLGRDWDALLVRLKVILLDSKKEKWKVALKIFCLGYDLDTLLVRMKVRMLGTKRGFQ